MPSAVVDVKNACVVALTNNFNPRINGDMKRDETHTVVNHVSSTSSSLAGGSMTSDFDSGAGAGAGVNPNTNTSTELSRIVKYEEKGGELDYDLNIPEYSKKAVIYGIIPFLLRATTANLFEGFLPNTVSFSQSTVSQDRLELTTEAIRNLAYAKQLEQGGKECPDPVNAVLLPAEEKQSSGHVVSQDNRRVVVAIETNSILLVKMHQPTDPVPPTGNSAKV
jgi:hypothetical protein